MKARKGRVVFHIDMNSFYASVEAVHDPSLRGKPLAIAGNPEERKGIVVTSSYEARAKGVKTTMQVWEALRKCPELIIRPPNFQRYRAASLEMFRLLEEYSPLVEPVSIDEGYMDMTDVFRNGAGAEIAGELQEKMKRDLGLPCSIGVAPNKFLAKMASDMKKPMGITILRKRELDTKLWPLAIGEMHGVGEKTAEKMKSLSIETIGDLACSDKQMIEGVFGVRGRKLHERANGHDLREVDPESVNVFKSIGNSVTLPSDTRNDEKIASTLKSLSASVARRMKKKEVCSSNIQITIRYKNRKTITRSRQLTNPLTEEEEIFKEAYFLFNKYWNEEPVRLLGITSLDVTPLKEAYKQLDLFTYKEEEKQAKLSETMEKLKGQFGEEIFNIKKSKTQKEERKDVRKGTSLDKDFLFEYWGQKRKHSQDYD
ncbi:DNA polymerase IV [Bacillus sp. FJAT-44742]|uniref:DNA polymerase IV n=1 Tax=Bacillus sp. FJAT-44742 TaxID=2014005 RepID=UPI000C23F0BC|nr:DNA polymerase IV [Bacillus sp. FJAT-44742]